MVNQIIFLKTGGKEYALDNILHFVSNIEKAVIFVVNM